MMREGYLLDRARLHGTGEPLFYHPKRAARSTGRAGIRRQWSGSTNIPPIAAAVGAWEQLRRFVVADECSLGPGQNFDQVYQKLYVRLVNTPVANFPVPPWPAE
jgi:hypothetical protein